MLACAKGKETSQIPCICYSRCSHSWCGTCHEPPHNVPDIHQQDTAELKCSEQESRTLSAAACASPIVADGAAALAPAGGVAAAALLVAGAAAGEASGGLCWGEGLLTVAWVAAASLRTGAAAGECGDTCGRNAGDAAVKALPGSTPEARPAGTERNMGAWSALRGLVSDALRCSVPAAPPRSRAASPSPAHAPLPRAPPLHCPA